MIIGLDFVRDWQWCLGVWILCGFASVFMNSLLRGFGNGERPPWIADLKVFVLGPIWWFSFFGASIGMVLNAMK